MESVSLIPTHLYEVRPRKDRRGVDLISDALPFHRLWYDTPDNAIGYAEHYSRSHDAVIRVYDEAGNVITPQEHAGAPAESLQLYCVHMKERECESSRPFKTQNMSAKGSYYTSGPNPSDKWTVLPTIFIVAPALGKSPSNTVLPPRVTLIEAVGFLDL